MDSDIDKALEMLRIIEDAVDRWPDPDAQFAASLTVVCTRATILAIKELTATIQSFKELLPKP